ncbi:MAG: c-type cytochrome [Betaproteobacteria bacterium]
MHRFIITAGLAALVASQASFVQAASTAPHPGRLLASNCFQCHGTEGRGGFETLAGKSSSEIYKEMKEMQAETAGQNIMNAHSRGYSDNELTLIADYFATLTR